MIPLTPERLARATAILDAIIDLAAAERPARLDALCGDDAELGALVLAILAHEATDDAPFEAAVADAITTLVSEPDAVAGQRVGPYRLIRAIGQGGMGTVYLAARDDREFQQQVAIKVVGGLLAADARQRFLAERQILASLEHPNIARLLDGGTTPDGLPYLVMEYVDGLPIDEYCDAHRLTIGHRLRLFAGVCDAVAHAHRRLVVHRDLKPTNILVAEGGAPKLLDFGIAKLLDEPEGASLTRTGGGFLLTPEYASPEQVRGDAITTASDVYALGVLLYELLTGERPLRVRSNRPDEIARAICDIDPPRPSTRVTRARAATRRADAAGRPDTLVARAAARATRPSRWRAVLAGDLDAIVMTALRKEPGRRYPSAEALADDVRRFLAGQPILARPSTWPYRARRFVARHRWSVAAAATVVVLLAGWIASTVIQAQRVARERDAALAVTGFLVDIFSSTDPAEARGRTVTARELLDRGAARIAQLGDRPGVQARLLDAMGGAYRSLGDTKTATALLREGLRLHERIEGRDQLVTAATTNQLAEVLREAGEYDESERLYREALSVRERRLGAVDADVAQSKNNLALLLRSRGRTDAARELFLQAIDIWKRTLGPRHLQVALGLSNLAQLERDRAQYAEAERLIREALAIRRAAYGGLHPQVANSVMSLGQVLDARGQDREAEPYLREALTMRERLYDADHPLVSAAKSNLASVLQDLGDVAGAEPLYRASLASERRRLGLRHPDTAIGANNLASLLEERGVFAEAETLYRESLDIRRERFGAGHASVARAMHNLARLLVLERRLAEAERLARGALTIRTRTLGVAHPETAQSLALVGVIRATAGHRAEGVGDLQDALARAERALGPAHPTVLSIRFDLGRMQLAAGHAAAAEPLLRSAAEGRARRLPDSHWLRAYTDVTLGRALAALGRHDEARRLVERGARVLAATLPRDDPRVREARAAIVG